MVAVKKITGRKVVPSLLFLILAFLSTWPLLGSVHTHLPLGMEDAATVPLFNLWSVWWNADRAAAGYSDYWEAPIFHPSRMSFAFSEPMPLSVLAAPVIWISGNRILAYNGLLLFFLWLNGMMAYVLLRRLRYGRLPALLGGALLEMLPLVHSFLGVLQLVPIAGILGTFFALYQLSRAPDAVGGALLGATLAATYLLCAYYGLFLFLLLVFCAGLLLWRQAFNPRIYSALILSIVLCVLICLPMIRAQQQVATAHKRDLPTAYLARLSADLQSYRVPPGPSAFEGNEAAAIKSTTGFKLAPGKIGILLMLMGTGWGLVRRSYRDWTLFCAALTVTSFLFSFGPRLQLLGWHPYLFLLDWVPGLAQLRNVFRFAVFVHIGVMLLAVQGLWAARVLIRRYLHRDRRRYATAVLAAVAVCALIEIRPAAQPLYAVPSVKKNIGWTRYLRDRTPADSVVVCVPFAFKPDVASYQQEALWLYWGTFHFRRMVNGYSGTFPQSFLDLKWPMAEFPTRKVITRLMDLEVDYCVVRRDTFYGEDMRRYCRFDPRVKMVYSDGLARIDIYRLAVNGQAPAGLDTGNAS